MRDDLARAVLATRAAVDAARGPVELEQIYPALGELEQLTLAVTTLTARLGDNVARLTAGPNLRVDEFGKPADPSVLADDAARALKHTADLLDQAATVIGTAWSTVGRLCIDTADSNCSERIEPTNGPDRGKSRQVFK